MGQIDRKGFKLPHPGPYIAKITNHLDPTYMGGVEAMLILGVAGRQELKNRVVPLQYLPAFYGITSGAFEGNSNNNFQDVQKSYGMWMVPPDVGTHVLCMFVESDSNQGFWIGCVQDRWQNHMVPGIAASTNVAWAPGQKAKYGNLAVPTGEFLKKSNKNSFAPNLEPKPVHPFADRLLKQGLLADPNRGITTSSARREIPSAVFGISTPGPLDSSGRKGKIGYDEKVEVPVSRLAGHTFVMDDGDVKGDNQLVRIRSSSGHQILLNDTIGIVYIANGNGTAWIEMTAAGKIDIFAADSISVHTEGDFNFRAERDFNLEAVRNINIKSSGNTVINSTQNFDLRVTGDGKVRFDGAYSEFVRGAYKVTSSGSMDLYSLETLALSANSNVNLMGAQGINLAAPKIKSNSGGATAPNGATDAFNATLLKEFVIPSTDGSLSWSSRYDSGSKTSIMQRVPMHEPWSQHESSSPALFAKEKTDVQTGGQAGNTGVASKSSSNPVSPPMNANTPSDWVKDDEFINKVKALAAKLKCDYLDLLAIMYVETAKTMSPSIKNPGSSATGLIQFLEKTAKGLGTNTGSLASMTRVQQMTYVEKYFMQFPALTKMSNPSVSDLYMAVFAPVGIGKPDNFPIYTVADGGAYSSNSRYDRNGDGKITKAEASQDLGYAKTAVKTKLGLK